MKDYSGQPARCETCGRPAMKKTNSGRHLLCDGPDCHAQMLRPIRVVGEHAIKCSGPGCKEWIPAGVYSANKNLFFHSPVCRGRYYKVNYTPNTKCLVCGKPLYRPYKNKPHFCSIRHFWDYKIQKTFAALPPELAAVLRRYEDEFARTHYRPSTFSSVRSYLIHLFNFMEKRGITDLEQVTPAVITSFINDPASKYFQINTVLNAVSTFMKWLIVQGLRKSANPVIARLHRRPAPKRLPRPYKDDEMDEIWNLAQARADTRVKLAIAIGEECGLRLGEVANLRLADVELDHQQLFVRIPNKTNTERWVPFHNKTVQYLTQWLAERPAVQHDHLFCNNLQGPMTVNTLRDLLKKALCKEFRKERHEDGLKRFSFHRLRHRLASTLADRKLDPALIMAIGGWSSFEAMQRYIEVRPEMLASSYHEAISKAKDPTPLPKTYSLQEFTRKNKAV